MTRHRDGDAKPLQTGATAAAWQVGPDRLTGEVEIEFHTWIMDGSAPLV